MTTQKVFHCGLCKERQRNGTPPSLLKVADKTHPYVTHRSTYRVCRICLGEVLALIDEVREKGRIHEGAQE